MTRHRSRYASDDQVRRVAKLAVEMGIRPGELRLGSDGSVSVVDMRTPGALTLEAGDADAQLTAWENEHGLAGGS